MAVKKHMISSWGDTVDLELVSLQQKTILLVTIASMWRSRSDIGKLQYRDIILKYNDQDLPIYVIMIVRFPKEINTKIPKVGALENLELCPVYTLYQLCKRTRHLSKGLPEYHPLFLANILQTKVNKVHSVFPVTITNWIKWELKQAGIETTKFKAHPLLSASSTKAVIKGAFIQSIEMHTNWSLNSDMIEKYYFKSRDQFSRGRDAIKTIFETDTENRTTFSAFVSPTFS